MYLVLGDATPNFYYEHAPRHCSLHATHFRQALSYEKAWPSRLDESREHSELLSQDSETPSRRAPRICSLNLGKRIEEPLGIFRQSHVIDLSIHCKINRTLPLGSRPAKITCTLLSAILELPSLVAYAASLPKAYSSRPPSFPLPKLQSTAQSLRSRPT